MIRFRPRATPDVIVPISRPKGATFDDFINALRVFNDDLDALRRHGAFNVYPVFVGYSPSVARAWGEWADAAARGEIFP